MDNIAKCCTLIGQLFAETRFDQSNAKVKLGESLSKNANNEFGGTSGQKLNNRRVSRWDILLLAPLHDGLGNVIIWCDHLDLGNLAIWVEEGGKTGN